MTLNQFITQFTDDTQPLTAVYDNNNELILNDNNVCDIEQIAEEYGNYKVEEIIEDLYGFQVTLAHCVKSQLWGMAEKYIDDICKEIGFYNEDDWEIKYNETTNGSRIDAHIYIYSFNELDAYFMANIAR